MGSPTETLDEHYRQSAQGPVREAIRDRYEAGESVESLSKDYGITEASVREVLRDGAVNRP